MLLLLLEHGRRGGEHLADGRLALHDGERVQTGVVRLLHQLRIALALRGREGVAGAADGVLAKVVVGELAAVAQEGAVEFEDVAPCNAHRAAAVSTRAEGGERGVVRYSLAFDPGVSTPWAIALRPIMMQGWL